MKSIEEFRKSMTPEQKAKAKKLYDKFMKPYENMEPIYVSAEDGVDASVIGIVVGVFRRM